MNVFNLIRTNEWWEYKFPPVLAVGYMVIVNSGHTFISLSFVLVILLLSLITGAAYVSMLNDATDITDDEVAGKKNRMARFSNFKKSCLVAIPLLSGLCFTIYYASDILTMLLYFSSYLCFTLYSLPPVRLKKRGVSGIFADAAGSQLFPTLCVAAFLFFKTQQPVNYYLIICIGAWSMCFGLRGILWHQFHDLEKDLLSGTKTIVQSLNKKEIHITGTVLIYIEFLTFAILLFTFKLLLPAIMLLIYFLYLAGLYKKWKVRTILIRPTQDAYRIFMNEYYQVFLPLSILVSVVLKQPSMLVILCVHILLFPANTIRICRELLFLILNKSTSFPGFRQLKKCNAFRQRNAMLF